MPTLEWIGKDKVINHHQEVPFRVLERRYSYDEAGQHDADNGSENMIVRGGQPGGAEGSAAPVRGPGEVHLHRSRPITLATRAGYITTM